MTENKLPRRDFLYLAGLTGAGAMLAACQPQVVKEVVKETVVVEKEKVVEKVVEKEVEKEVTRVIEVGARDIPREKTLIYMFGGSAGMWPDAGLGNVYGGLSHQNGVASMLEPLAFYSAFAGEEILWLAEGYAYNDDYTELTIKIRKGAEWSDGVPFTAKDVVFTIDMLIKHAPLLRNSGEIKEWVKENTLVDDYTCRITFHKPNPRFFYDFLSFKFDTGNYIVPEHIFKDIEDVSTFVFYDPDKGWPVYTGPYRLAIHSQTQRFFDRRDDWWAAKIGFAKLPEVERIIVLPSAEESRMIQMAINGSIDGTHLSVAGVKEV
ncbi:MAG: twin-arginine translocation signal domain-containing protein, partial [Chloroflexi bacterium]|nr:twin-arginine translocation signal domain-containing protein [Chloroflexota bacterium]